MNLIKNITCIILMSLGSLFILQSLNIASKLDRRIIKTTSYSKNQRLVSPQDLKFFNALSRRESSNNPKAQNSFGYIGKYQFGEEALAITGYYIKDNTRKNDWIGKWTGKNGVYSKDDYLNNTIAQDNAAIELASKNWKFAKYNGLDAYVGKVISGIYITKSGIVASMHLLGSQRVIKFLKHGTTNYDGYGTSVKEYMRHFATSDLTRSFA